MGMLYEWGRKDPFTFATSSLKWGAGPNDYGKYPVKMYNGKSELIYQENIGNDNTEKTPLGGLIHKKTTANSMMETIRKPNLFYGVLNTAVVSQIGHSKELWDYYWTSHSRGTDGQVVLLNSLTLITTWHNTYLDGYIVLRSKSIYDPCHRKSGN